MNWSDAADDWPAWSRRIRDRFPQLEPGQIARARYDREACEAYIARRQNISLIEAREEIEDLLYIETLAHELATAQ